MTADQPDPREKYTWQKPLGMHVKRKIRTEKRADLEEMAKEVEEAAQKGEQRVVYKITKLIYRKYSGSRDAPIRDKEGQLLTFAKD